MEIPPDNRNLAEDIHSDRRSAGAARQGKNGFGKIGYGGPCPPSGTHRYYFRLYALDNDLPDVRSGVSREELENAMKGHILAEAELIGKYERKKAGSR